MSFQTYIQEIRELIQENATVAINGKTIHRSKSTEKKVVHVVMGFASEMKLVLGQLATDEKNNEIMAIPKLIELFCKKGMIITIAAMGTQTEIADKIIEKKGDYVLALKRNQPLLPKNISLYLETEILTQKKNVLQEQGR